MTQNDIDSIQMELASDRAHDRLLRDKELGLFPGDIYEDADACITIYTDEAQDLFNEYYEDYHSLIEEFKTTTK